MSTIHQSDPNILDRLLEKFSQSDCCWVGTVRPDSRVHLAPIWHVWHKERAYLVTPATSVRAHNLEQNSSISLSLSDPLNVFIMEGIARSTPEMQAELQPLFQIKYDWNIVTDKPYNCILEITPVKIMAWGDHGEGRWHFENGMLKNL